MTDPATSVDRLARGVVSTFGAGLFLGLAPASALSGRWLLAGVVAAAGLAVLFVLSTSDSPVGRGAAALGILGRIAAAVAVAAACGEYVVPERPEAGGAVLVVVVAAVVLLAPPLPGLVDRVAAVVVVAVLLVLAVACFTIAPVALAVPPPPDAAGTDDLAGLLPATALLYVCFVGARAAPGRRERVAVVLVVLAVSAAVAVGVLRQLGGQRLALSPAPLRDVLVAADAASLDGLLAVGVTVACAFALRGALCDVRELAAAVRADRSPTVAVGLAAGIAALGVLLLDPVHALVGAALLLLGEAVIRMIGGLRGRA